MVLFGLFGFSSEIQRFERIVYEQEERGIYSHDEAIRLRDARNYLGELKQTSYITTGSGLIITFVGTSMFFKKRREP